ncbi:hypothetical protein C0J52_06458 [Blattella germanica]|nr:hypothetical protein C0J52_06458 [Blattella germanica]
MIQVELGLSTSGEPEGTDNEGFSQEWYEDDFDISNTRREAEELRLQQLQIEQEEQLPYFYFREIPNKPPPPYTPPGQTARSTLTSAGTLRKSSEECLIIPSTPEELTSLVKQVTAHLHGILTTGGNIHHTEAPPGFYEDRDSSLVCDIKTTSRRIFKKMIFDLTKDMVKEAYGLDGEISCKPWEWPAFSCKRTKESTLPYSKEMLQKKICNKVLFLFGYTPKTHKDKLLVCWNRKRRDIVDEILMKESHEEESNWINYEEDEVMVKNEIAMEVLDTLLDETVQIFLDIKKSQLDKSYALTLIT